MKHFVLALLTSAGALVATSASAQFGPAAPSPPPAGLQEGQSAGYPAGRYDELDALPDWGGIWFLNFEMPAPGAVQSQPKLKGEYLERYEAWRQAVIANNGDAPRNRSNCSPPGMPILMQIPQYPFEYLFTPGRVTINQEAWMQSRTIWTDGRQLPEDPSPAFNGHSIGKWEGGTLVVDTIGLNEDIELGMGMFHSAQLSVRERIRLDGTDPDKLVNTITLTDPLALEEPYNFTVSYKRDRNGALLEFQCAENDRNPVDAEGRTEFH
ncbi:hypothetical protein [Tsuneonella sp. HG222]